MFAIDTMKFKIAVLAGAVALGGLAGIAAQILLYKPEAVTILRLGSSRNLNDIDGETAALLALRATTPEFADLAAKRFGDASAASSLVSKRFGGQGRLSVRESADGTYMEVRVQESSAERAVKLVQAVTDEMLSDRNAKVDLRVFELESERSELSKQKSDNEAFLDQITGARQSQAPGARQSASGESDSFVLLSLQNTVISISREVRGITLAIRLVERQRSVVIARPRLLGSFFAKPEFTAGSGALLGLLAGYLLLTVMAAARPSQRDAGA